MPMHVRVGGAWKEVAAPAVRVSGTWKAIVAGYVRVSGTWKEFFSATPPSPCSISGSLDGSDSTSIIDGAVRTVTVPSGNSGTLRFQGQAGTFTGFNARVNGGSLQDITSSGATLVWADTQTIQIRAAGVTSGTATVDVYDDDTNTFLQTVTLTRL